MALRQILFAEITRLYPDMKSKLAERYANKYCSAVLKELRSAVQRPHNDNEELSFNTTQTNIDCGRIKYNNQTIWLWAFMNRSPSTRLLNERFRGQLGKYKRVVMNPIYKEMIMDELIEEPTNVLTTRELDELMAQANRVVPVDVVSLRGFIEQSQQTLIGAKQDTN